MNRRQHDVVLKRKAAVGGLYPVVSADARHLACEQPLILARTNVFYDGVTEDDIERSIREGKHSAVCPDQVCVLPMGREGRRHIEDRELRPASREAPDLRRTTHVQNTRPFRDVEGPLEQPQAPTAEIPESSF